MSVHLRLTSCRVISMSALGYEGQEVGVHIRCLFFSLTSLLSRAGSGTIYFTSIRKEKGAPFTVCTFYSIKVLSLNLSLTNTPQCASKLFATMELLFTFRTLFLSRLLLSTETLSLMFLGLSRSWLLQLTLTYTATFVVQPFRASELHCLGMHSRVASCLFTRLQILKHHSPFSHLRLLKFKRKCPT